MNPPKSVFPIIPSQSTSKITNIVHSICFLSVGSHVPSWDTGSVALMKTKISARYRYFGLLRDGHHCSFPRRRGRQGFSSVVSESCRETAIISLIDDDPHGAVAQLGHRRYADQSSAPARWLGWKVRGNLMIDLHTTSAKLRDRAVRVC